MRSSCVGWILAEPRREQRSCREAEHRRLIAIEPALGQTYRGHQDISDVMLATSLRPDGFLVLRHHDFIASRPG
jgi:hypothetical protein